MQIGHCVFSKIDSLGQNWEKREDFEAMFVLDYEHSTQTNQIFPGNIYNQPYNYPSSLFKRMLQTICPGRSLL